MSSAAAMMNRLREAYHHDEFLAFSSDPSMRAILTDLAKHHDWPEFTVNDGGVAAAIQLLVTTSSPRRLIVDLGDAADPVTAVQMLRDTCAAETVIIAVGAVNDVKLYREICRVGATDYIVKPTTREHLDEAIERANGTRFGLQAGIFTSSIDIALDAADRLEFGGVVVNEAPTFRSDQMPYGGVKASGNTREGPAYAVREMTEERLVVIQR